MQPFDHIVLAIPHAWPICEFWLWSDPKTIGKDMNRWTDWHTDDLFTKAGNDDPRIRFLVGQVSRFDCDLERLEDDPLEKIGQGRLYTRSHSGATRTVPEERARKWLGCWREWRLAARHLALDCPRPILLDCHSFPSDLAPDVDVCLGFNEDATKPDDDVLYAILAALDATGLRVAFNVPYGNALSPEGFPGPSLLVELNKALYMDERRTTRLEGPAGGWKRTVNAIRVLCDTLLGGRWTGDEYSRKLLTKYDAKRCFRIPKELELHEWGETTRTDRFGRTVVGFWWRSGWHIEVKCNGPEGVGCAGVHRPYMKYLTSSHYLSKDGTRGDELAKELLDALVTGREMFVVDDPPGYYKFCRCTR